MTQVVPKYVFLVPYRNREAQKEFFMRHMAYLLEDYEKDSYQIYYVHQRFAGSFNRGGVKNAGFQAVCSQYPNREWEDIIFVFHDLDCLPYKKNYLTYDTPHNVVRHFYGFPNTLGGMFAIRGRDFARINGFPMFWYYGWEDNEIQNRVLKRGMTIDRSQFHSLYDPNILAIRDGVYRKVSREEFNMYIRGSEEGLRSVSRLKYEFDKEFIHVNELSFGRPENTQNTFMYDLRKGNAPFENPNQTRYHHRNMNKKTFPMLININTR